MKTKLHRLSLNVLSWLFQNEHRILSYTSNLIMSLKKTLIFFSVKYIVVLKKRKKSYSSNLIVSSKILSDSCFEFSSRFLQISIQIWIWIRMKLWELQVILHVFVESFTTVSFIFAGICYMILVYMIREHYTLIVLCK